MAYVKQDRSCSQPYQIIFLPYLHERRVYLNTIREGQDYFYTTIEAPQEDINQHTLELAKLCNMEERKFEQRLHGQSTKLGQSTKMKSVELQKAVHQRGVYQKDSHGKVKDSIKLRLLAEYYKSDQVEIDTFMAIISMKLSSFTYRVFSSNGILMNHVNFAKQVKKYGQPIAVSPNGLNFIFKKSDDENDAMRRNLQEQGGNSSAKNEALVIRQHFKFHVMTLTIFGMCHLKQINLLDGMMSYFIEHGGEGERSYAKFLKNQRWLYKDDLAELQKTCYMIPKINDNADVCIQLKTVPPMRQQKRSYENQFSLENKELPIWFMLSQAVKHNFNDSYDQRKGNDKAKESTILYYYESLPHNLNLQEILQKNGLKMCNSLIDKLQHQIVSAKENSKFITHQVIQTIGHFDEDFEINDQYLFIREFGQIQYLQMSESIFTEDEELIINKLNLEVDVKQGCGSSGNYIKDIRVSSNPNEIAIIIGRFKQHNDMVLHWDVQKNHELQFFQLNGPYHIIWDHRGAMYILEKDKVIDASKNCTLKTYSFQDLEQHDNQQFRYKQMYNKGIHLDGKNKNWLILRQYLSLSYCYMTFVIQDNISREGYYKYRNTNQFDSEAFNYIMNKSSAFLDLPFVVEDYDQLHDILSNFNKIDKEMLQLLNFTIPERRIRESDGKELNVQKSALSRALDEGSYKNVSLILKMMSRNPKQEICIFSHLFKDLLDYESFQQYLQNTMMKQTISMAKKQIFRTDKPLSSKIVAICESTQSFTDNGIYFNLMGEYHKHEKGVQAFPVKMEALCVGWIFDKQNEEHALEFFDELLAHGNLDFFKINGLQVLIEFLYSYFQKYMRKIVFPPFVIFSVALIYYIFLNESYQLKVKFILLEDKTTIDYIEQSEESMDSRPWLRAYNVIWFFVCLINISIIILKMKVQGLKQFMWDLSEVADLLLGVLGFVIFFIVADNESGWTNDHFVLDPKDDMKQYERHEIDTYKRDIMAERILFVIMAQLFVYKLFMFMKNMSRKFDILIEIIVSIFYDIIHLVIIMIIWAGVSAFSFYLIAQNQLNFDEVNDNDKDSISYGSAIGSGHYIYSMLLGDSDFEAFTVGKSSQSVLLRVIFVLTTFIIMIHLLNMLIAVMGNTFNERALIAMEINYKNHLHFVRDHWHLIDIHFKQLRHIKYLIAACHEEINSISEDHEFEEMILNKLANQDSQLQILLQGQSKGLLLQKKINQSTQNSLEIQKMSAAAEKLYIQQ